MTKNNSHNVFTKESYHKISASKTTLLADPQIHALGRWNQQYTEGVFTRRNGYTSYSLLKMMLSRQIQG
jgi:hypothetical protein